MRFQRFFFDCVREGRLTAKRAVPLLRAVAPVLLPLWALLALLPGLLGAWGGAGAWSSGPQMRSFLSLLSGALLEPLFFAACAYALAARWEQRSFDLTSTCVAIRARIGRVLLTGVCVWLVIWGVEMLSGLLHSLLLLVDSLLGWMPLVGTLIAWLATALLFTVSSALAFLSETMLIAALLALLGDGFWASAQARQVLRIFWGGRTDLWPGLTGAFAAWLAVDILLALCGLASVAGAYAGACLEALRLILLAGVVGAMYLTERDRQDGVHLHAM